MRYSHLALRFMTVRIRAVQRVKTVLLLALASSFAFSFAGCDKRAQQTSNTNRKIDSNTTTGPSAAEIVDRYRKLDDSRDSVTRLRAHISGQSEEMNAAHDLQLTIYRKREADGRLLMLIDFIAPAEERDRDGLVTVYSDGRIEGVRFVESSGSFIETKDASSEDSLFGLTLQELADGQPDKYDFTFAGDDTVNAIPVYRLDGKLKAGAESKFPRTLLMISKQDFAVVQAEFYDNHNELARRLSVGKFDNTAGHWTRKKWSIDNVARQKKIDFDATDIKYDQNLSESLFTRDHLKQIASR